MDRSACIFYRELAFEGDFALRTQTGAKPPSVCHRVLMQVPDEPLTVEAETHAPLRVRFGETDLMGIVHHAAYLSYFELARVEYLRRRGVIYARWAEGRHLPVVSAGLEYLRSARFDEELVVVARLALLTRVRLGFAYQVRREQELLCRGHTVLCCVDDAGRPRRIPEDLAQAVLGPEGV